MEVWTANVNTCCEEGSNRILPLNQNLFINLLHTGLQRLQSILQLLGHAAGQGSSTPKQNRNSRNRHLTTRGGLGGFGGLGFGGLGVGVGGPRGGGGDVGGGLSIGGLGSISGGDETTGVYGAGTAGVKIPYLAK